MRVISNRNMRYKYDCVKFVAISYVHNEMFLASIVSGYCTVERDEMQ